MHAFFSTIFTLGALVLSQPFSPHPTYRYCHAHRCTRWRQVYEVRCGDGELWLSPRPVPHPGRHCENVPSF